MKVLHIGGLTIPQASRLQDVCDILSDETDDVSCDILTTTYVGISEVLIQSGTQDIVDHITLVICELIGEPYRHVSNLWEEI